MLSERWFSFYFKLILVGENNLNWSVILSNNNNLVSKGVRIQVQTVIYDMYLLFGYFDLNDKCPELWHHCDQCNISCRINVIVCVMAQWGVPKQLGSREGRSKG